jgi:hypothetical protein
MFGLSRTKTELEVFCYGLSPENISRPLSDPEEKHSQAIAVALLLLLQAGRFLSDLSADKHLKKYYKRVNSDLVLLETIFYLHAMLSYSAMDEMYDEDEALSILNEALSGVLGTVENKSSITDIDRLKRARNYVPSIKSSTERLALILEHACFGKAPILNPSIDLKNASAETHLGLKVQTVSFAQAQIPACTEIIENIIEGRV